MAKFDFNNTRYAKFFSSRGNRAFLSTFINTEGILFTNYKWYLTQGRKAPAPTPTAVDGTATFTVKERILEAAPLADLRAPLADSNQMDSKGIALYTASIPDFITPGFVETAMEREDKLRRFEMFGNDADIVASWVENVQIQKDSMDGTFNFMTAQLMCGGKIDYRGIGRGIQAPLHKAAIPEDNFCKAGAKVWTDPEAKILTYMQEIEKKYRDKWGFNGAMKWQMTRNMFLNTFLKNAEVVELVNNYRTINDLATTKSIGITENTFNQAYNEFRVSYGISPIEIVEERERNLTNSGDAFVSGWDDKIAVLRPAGDAVAFMYTDSLDQQMFQKYGNKAIDKVFAPINGGLGTLVNTTIGNGNYTEWHTDLMFSACPALVEFTKHVIVDTSTAN